MCLDLALGNLTSLSYRAARDSHQGSPPSPPACTGFPGLGPGSGGLLPLLLRDALRFRARARNDERGNAGQKSQWSNHYPGWDKGLGLPRVTWPNTILCLAPLSLW